jgi:hypothetical protein
MKPDREDRPAGPARLRDARRRDARRRDAWRRDAWRRRSLAGGWLTPDDWHSEAVDAVLAACRPGSPPGGGQAAACTGLGRARARAGTGIAETIDDLAALFAVLEEALPVGLIGAVAEGWADESQAQLARDGCEDPLSGLATLPYLRTRLAEVYREAEQGGTSPAETHRLLVVGLPRRPDPWRRLALPILVGRDLRAAFPGGETLALAKPGPAIALVPARRDLPLRYARLRRNIQAAFGTQIRMTPLPGRLTEALRLVDELAR